MWGFDTFLNSSLDYICIIRNATFDVSLDMRVHTTSGISRANRVVIEVERVFEEKIPINLKRKVDKNH